MTRDDVKAEVRSLTDYGEHVLPVGDLDDLLDTARRDIAALVDQSMADIDWYSEGSIGRRALVWTVCLFALLKAREMDSGELSLDALTMDGVRAAGQQYGNDPVIWLSRARSFVRMLDDRAGSVVRVDAAREDRIYGEDRELNTSFDF